MLPNRFNMDHTDPLVGPQSLTAAKQQRADCDAWWAAEMKVLGEFGAPLPVASGAPEHFTSSDIFSLSSEEFALKWQRVNSQYQQARAQKGEEPDSLESIALTALSGLSQFSHRADKTVGVVCDAKLSPAPTWPFPTGEKPSALTEEQAANENQKIKAALEAFIGVNTYAIFYHGNWGAYTGRLAPSIRYRAKILWSLPKAEYTTESTEGWIAHPDLTTLLSQAVMLKGRQLGLPEEELKPPSNIRTLEAVQEEGEMIVRLLSFVSDRKPFMRL